MFKELIAILPNPSQKIDAEGTFYSSFSETNINLPLKLDS